MNPPEDGPESSVGSEESVVAPPAPVTLRIPPDRFVARLAFVWVSIEIALLLFDYFFNYGGVHFVEPIRRLANLGHESSLANLIAVLQTFLLALTAWAVFVTARARNDSVWRRRGWLVVALFFTYLAVDDGARVHERIGTAAEMVFEGWAASRGGGLVDYFPSYAWQVAVLPWIVAVGAVALVFLWFELRARQARTLIALGLFCLVAAVVLDFLEGLSGSHALNPYTWIVERIDLAEWTRARFHKSPYVTLLHFSKDVEEVLEMLGTTLIWVAVLSHWMRSVELRIRFSGD